MAERRQPRAMMKERRRSEVLWRAEMGLRMDLGMDGGDVILVRMKMERR